MVYVEFYRKKGNVLLMITIRLLYSTIILDIYILSLNLLNKTHG